jgi:DNA-directed RNA polymerase subunit N (RpoN/RPB10)
MIIPIKCFTCGNVLANKYRYYLEKVRAEKVALLKSTQEKDVDRVVYLTTENMKKTPEAIVLDKLGLFSVCCRRHMLTHVNIE